MNVLLSEKLLKLPRNPGVYIYKNSKGAVIYVGKAKSLKERVGSYFHLDIHPDTKTAALVNRINDVEYILVESELEALILEAELIKKYHPKYNVIQKDDKSYLYIVVRPEIVLLNNSRTIIKKVLTLRKTDLKPKDVVFGPFPDGTTAKFIVKTIRKLFPFRDCSYNKFSTYHKKGKSCLYGFLGVCPAPCINYSQEDLMIYKKNINAIKHLLGGDNSKIVTDLQSQMKMASKLEQFESASRYRDLLKKYQYIRQQFKSPEIYINNPYFVSDIAESSLKELVDNLPFLKGRPARIECYDISNISGKDAVGSLVVATNGIIDKNQYRKFKIKFKNTPDDFDMIYQVLSRRFRRKDWKHPNLLIVDGGKGQVSAAIQAAEDEKYTVPIIGLAKKEEIVVYKQDQDFIELKLEKNNSGLQLLIKLRDEAHRFAQSYHHYLRTKSLVSKNVNKNSIIKT